MTISIYNARRPLKIQYEPLSFQKTFHEAVTPKVLLTGGLGCGKTYSLCMKMFRLMRVNRGLPGGMLGPTLKMLKRDVVPTIREICSENNIEYKFNKQDFYFYFPQTDSTIYLFHGEDDGDSIRGPNLAFMLINEVSKISKMAFLMATGRVRLKEAPLLQVAMSGTPEGFQWDYEYFIENPRDDTTLIFGSTRENHHVADSYVGMLEQSYDRIMQDQFIDGKYLNTNGKAAAWSFSRFIHVKKDLGRIEGAPVWVSLDFNLNPMAATLWNRLPTIEGGAMLRAFKSIKLMSSDTHQMADAIIQELGPGYSDCIIYPDPAGNAGSTKSRGKSDIAILEESGFKNILFRRRIVSVRDCLNSMNNLFDKNQVEIDAGCTDLIADLEQCVLKDDGTIDKSNPSRTHWLDGFKDMCDYEFPVIKPVRSSSTQL